MAFEKNLVVIAIFIVLGTLASQATSRTLSEASIAAKHDQWMTKYGRVYADNAEKERRFAIFKNNVQFVEKFNTEGNKTYKLGLNEHSDLSDEEFLRKRTGYNRATELTSSANISFRYKDLSPTDVPPSIDWREKGAVTPIKNQGSCGCCWAFSAVAAVEGISQIKSGKLISLSEQQLLDCTSGNGNQGCNGGFMLSSFEYIQQNGGIASEENYPYQAVQGTCNASQPAVQITGYEKVPANSEDDLLKAVSMQPVSIAIVASGDEFKNYQGGVFSPTDCGTQLDHAVTAVGYGTTEDGTKYWLLKNQWGESWGENGYMKILRDAGAPEGVCGLAQEASYPTA
ncbi:ervatamin-C-like [Prunus yedoensis var. nudiflora]|uniref:Ervatamin-C-like n=1 Tax=Prunus yedoensis var. nudiflora TaxID=2094558 RepID=A0A314YLS9_PRUYE|nr:ervatamin-C-like [Prunus yedoensis var. nudiflora]